MSFDDAVRDYAEAQAEVEGAQDAVLTTVTAFRPSSRQPRKVSTSSGSTGTSSLPTRGISVHGERAEAANRCYRI